jgi:hypothetical protein
MKRVIRSDKPITSVFPVKSQNCDFGAEPKYRLFATSASKGLRNFHLIKESRGTFLLLSTEFLGLAFHFYKMKMRQCK